MNFIEAIVCNESTEDALTVFALNAGFPRLDRMYARYKHSVVLSGELFSVYQRLIEEGVLVRNGSMALGRGPNWKAPAFLTEGKYDELIKNEPS